MGPSASRGHHRRVAQVRRPRWTAAILTLVASTAAIDPVRADERTAPEAGAETATAMVARPDPDRGATARALDRFERRHGVPSTWAAAGVRGGACPVDNARRVLRLVMGPDGRLRCRFDGVGLGYRLELWLLAPVDLAAGYAIWLEQDADRRSERLVRGKDEPTDPQDPIPEPTWVKQELGEVTGEGLAVKVVLAEGGVAWRTRIPVHRLHRYRISALAATLRGEEAYRVEDGRIVGRRDLVTFDYFVSLHGYPLAWRREPGGWRYGRYHSDHLTRARDRVSAMAALSLTAPTSRFFLGLAFEVVPGIALAAGWAPTRIERLAAGYAAGQPVTGDAAPTTTAWALDRVAIGVSLDSALVARAIAFFN